MVVHDVETIVQEIQVLGTSESSVLAADALSSVCRLFLWALSSQYSNVYASVGVHPDYEDIQEPDIDTLLSTQLEVPGLFNV